MLRISSSPLLRAVPVASPKAPPKPATADLFEVAKAVCPAPSTGKRTPAQAVSDVLSFNQRLALAPEHLATKYEMMSESPVEFFRINPQLFHSDLRAGWAREASLLGRSAPRITVVGDVHVGNFGTVRGPGGPAVWGLNDFDQAGVSSIERDLERLATSLVLEAQELGFAPELQQSLVRDALRAYLTSVRARAIGAPARPAALGADEATGKVAKLVGKQDAARREKFLTKRISTDEQGRARLVRGDEVRDVSPEVQRAVRDGLAAYARRLPRSSALARPLRILDVAEKLGSGGSTYGLPRHYALVASALPHAPPIILEVKALLASPFKDVSGDLSKASGLDATRAQRALGGSFNPLTGHARIDGRASLVRELEWEKDDLALDDLEPEEWREVALQGGSVLGRAHAQSRSTAREILRWMGNDEARATERLLQLAQRYAEQTRAYHAAFIHR